MASQPSSFWLEILIIREFFVVMIITYILKIQTFISLQLIEKATSHFDVCVRGRRENLEQISFSETNQLRPILKTSRGLNNTTVEPHVGSSSPS